MNNKKIIFVLILIIILLLICNFCFYLEVKHIEKSIIETDITYFEPFSKNNILKTYYTTIKLKKNLPKIEAASAFYPFTANLVQSIYDKDSYSKELLQLVSTSQAYLDIINGETDIIIATKPSDEQKEMIKNTGVDLKYKVIYLEPLAILVNNSNNIDNLSIEQIKDIYCNNNSKYNTYQLEKNNGSQTCLESIVKNNELGKKHYELHTMPEIVDRIALDKNGIGYTFYSYYSKMHMNKNTKIIKVNGKDIDSEDYPLLFEVCLIYRNDDQNENISEIVNWLETDEGKKIVEYVK